MATVEVDLTKTVQQNAAVYYEKAKKAKKKSKGAEDAIIKLQKERDKLAKDASKKIKKEHKALEEKRAQKARKQQWYEKFHWFYSSEGFLCIGGRDATQNEIVVKKHAKKGDLIFHTLAAGSPFFVVQAEGKEVGEATIKEVAIATASYSRAWKSLGTTEVFRVLPEQVSKQAEAGEYLPKGGFMIRGKKTFVESTLHLAVGLYEGVIMAGPVAALKKQCEKYVEILPGDEKTAAVAKKIHKKIGGMLDDIIKVLPAGGCRIKA